MKADTTFFCPVVKTSYTIADQENDVKATCAAKTSMRVDLNKTRNLTNTLRVKNSLANRLTFYFSYILKTVLTTCGFVSGQKVLSNFSMTYLQHNSYDIRKLRCLC